MKRYQRPILVLNNIGNALGSLSQLKMRQRELGEAREFLKRSIETYREVLNLAPGYQGALSNIVGEFVHLSTIKKLLRE